MKTQLIGETRDGAEVVVETFGTYAEALAARGRLQDDMEANDNDLFEDCWLRAVAG
jgi:hypothetical protein